MKTFPIARIGLFRKVESSVFYNHQQIDGTTAISSVRQNHRKNYAVAPVLGT